MKYEGYLIDLDGTMYRGKERIEEAVEFVKLLQREGIPYLFITNNSANTQLQVTEKLHRFGVPTGPEQVITSSMATAEYMKRNGKGHHFYMIGEEGLEEALTTHGFQMDECHPDYVVMGIDRKLTYEKLSKACLAVRNGATLLSTNKDVAFPTEIGLVPGNGAITSVVSVSTGVQPIFIGKPEPIIMQLAMEKLGLPKENVLMVGDNYHTDILAGQKAGIDTLLVYTGFTKKEDLDDVKELPTHTIESLDLWDIRKR